MRLAVCHRTDGGRHTGATRKDACAACRQVEWMGFRLQANRNCLLLYMLTEMVPVRRTVWRLG